MRLVRMGMIAAALAGAAAGPAVSATLEQIVPQIYRSETRLAAIAALESLLVTDPTDRAVRLPLARALSWSGRLDDAVAQYDTLLSQTSGPDSSSLFTERLRVVLWQGRLSDAEKGFAVALQRDPTSVDAMLGLAQARRWSGRPLAALGIAKDAERAAPTRSDVREELARSWAALGFGRSAARSVVGMAAIPPDLKEALHKEIGPIVNIIPLVSNESFGVLRSTVRTVISGEIPGARFAVGTASTRLESAGTILTYTSGAASASLRGPHAWLEAGLGMLASRDTLLPDVALEAGLRVSDRLQASLGMRRRPFLESAPALETDEGAFYAAGAGGATDLASTARLTVDEVRGQLRGSSTGWIYAYADARGFRVADGNRAYALATGLGVDPLRALGARNPLHSMVQWDGYWAGYARARPSYYSPPGFDAEGVGLSARWPAGPHLTLIGSGGGTFSFVGTSHGWYAGGGIEVRGPHVEAKLRAEVRDDVYSNWKRAWLSVSLLP